MQGWTTKVDSIGARLVHYCSVESKIGLPDSENRATLDRHYVCADKLAMAATYAGGWSSFKYARRR
jgi:hypothetical protein